MNSQLDYEAMLRQAMAIDPYHHEFPAWCVRCDGRWSIYRADTTTYAALHEAAAALHCDLSPDCKPDHVRVANPVPYGEAAPSELEEHADSPFVRRGALDCDHDPARSA